MKCDKRLLEIKGTIVTIIRPNNDEVINPLKHIRFDEADLLNMMEYSHMTDRHRWKMLVSDKLKGYNFKYHGKIRFFRYDTGMANSSSDDFSYTVSMALTTPSSSLNISLKASSTSAILMFIIN